MRTGWSGGQWFEVTSTLQPMVSLVYPNVYPAKVDGSEGENWRGLWRLFRFRPSHHLFFSDDHKTAQESL